MSSSSNNVSKHRQRSRIRLAATTTAALLALLVCTFLQPQAGILMAADEKPPGEITGQTAPPQGRPYTIRFEGNQAVSEDELKEKAADELSRFAREGQQRYDVDDAAFQMELHYHLTGFAFTTVDYEYEDTGEEIQVIFLISEGPRVLLGEVTFTGNTVFSDEELLSFFDRGSLTEGKEAFVESDVEEAAGKIRELYFGSGYLKAAVGDPVITFSEERTRADISLGIEEGPIFLIREVNFHGEVLEEANESLSKLARKMIGQPFFNRQRLVLITRTLEIYGNLGYPDVHTEVKVVHHGEPGDTALEATIESGPRVRISGISVRGNKETREDFILSRVGLKAGDWFDTGRINKSFRELYRTGIFKRVSIELEGGEKDTDRPLLVNVEEFPTKDVYFEVGWGSYEKARGLIGFLERNLMGRGRMLRAEATASTRGGGLRLTASNPWFLGTDITASLPLVYSKRKEPSFDEEKLEMSFNLTKRVSRRITSLVKYFYQFSSITNVKAGLTQADLEDNYNMGGFKVQSTFDNRNDVFFPTGGQMAVLAGEVVNPSLGGDLSFFRIVVGLKAFFALGGDTTFGLRYDTGFMVPTSDEAFIPLGERFFNGGENTVRSFYESELGPKDLSGEPLGGLAFNVVNVELRQRLTGNLYGSVFVDYGNVSPNKSRIEEGLPPFESRSEIVEATFDQYFSDFRPGVGIGLNYVLPIGPMRLDAAWNPDRREGEDKYAIHLSLGMAF